jgi:hypothetical protein
MIARPCPYWEQYDKDERAERLEARLEAWSDLGPFVEHCIREYFAVEELLDEFAARFGEYRSQHSLEHDNRLEKGNAAVLRWCLDQLAANQEGIRDEGL